MNDTSSKLSKVNNHTKANKSKNNALQSAHNQTKEAKLEKHNHRNNLLKVDSFTSTNGHTDKDVEASIEIDNIGVQASGKLAASSHGYLWL